jgi:amino acid permease
MPKDFFKNYIVPASIFCSGIVGVGFLSLPYLAMQTGIWVMLFWIVVVTGLLLVVNSLFADISLKTPDFKRFPGFVGYYLGKPMGIFAALTFIVFGFAVLAAYILVGGQFLAAAFPSWFSGSPIAFEFLYFIIASSLLLLSQKAIAKAETVLLGLFFVSILIVCLEALGQLHWQSVFFQPKLSLPTLFLPYGPLLFSAWAIGFIPPTEEAAAGNKKNLKKILMWSTIVMSVFYAVFIVAVLGISGSETTEVALTGLSFFLSRPVVFLALFAAFLVSLNAFAAQGVVLKQILEFDLKIKPWQALIMTAFIPMILIFIGLNSFISLISFTGGVFLGIYGLMILWMHKKIGGNSKWFYPLMVIFIVGMVYTLLTPFL